MHYLRGDFVRFYMRSDCCGGTIAAATVKINKIADGGFPRWEGKQGEFLLIFSNDDCIIK